MSYATRPPGRARAIPRAGQISRLMQAPEPLGLNVLSMPDPNAGRPVSAGVRNERDISERRIQSALELMRDPITDYKLREAAALLRITANALDRGADRYVRDLTREADGKDPVKA